MTQLSQLADLLRRHQQITNEIAALIGRPAERGHIGEFIAEHIFAITAERQANNKGSDGVFTTGSLAGKRVNVKFYGVKDNLLDLNTTDSPPDYYLVLTGRASAASSSRGLTRPFTIEHVYLFEHQNLVESLNAVKVGIATSVRRTFWDVAEIYPEAKNPLLVLNEAQREQLGMFHIK